MIIKLIFKIIIRKIFVRNTFQSGLVILFLIFPATFFGQSSNYFVNPNATWNVAKTFPDANMQNPMFASTVTKVYGFDGDTLIGGQLWNRTFFTSDPDFLSNKTYLGNVRQGNGVVLFMDTSNIIDTIYNFNLQSGDSIGYDFGAGLNYLFVTNIDSIIIEGNYHKRFFFSEPTGPNAFIFVKEIWIDGIGSIHGPLFPAKPTVFSTEAPDSLLLTCFKINDTVIWHHPNYNECYINIVLSENDFKEAGKNIFTFPNPVTNELRIEFPENINEDFHISIFNLEGKLIMKKFVTQNGMITIDTEILEKGFYIMQVECGNRIFRTKFSKQ